MGTCALRQVAAAKLALSAALLALTPTGCRLAGVDSRSLAANRQFSRQAMGAMEHGQWDRAETLLAQAIRACPSDGESRSHYAEALWRRGSRAEAVAQLTEALRRSPDRAEFYARLAEMHLEMGQDEPAFRAAQQAITLDPKLASAWAVRAQVLQRQNRLLEALADYHRALHYAPADREIPLEIARLHLELQQPDRALAAIQGMAERCAPGEEPQQALCLQAQIYRSLGRHEEAAEVLEAVCSRSPATVELLGQLAEAQAAAGHRAEAAATAQRVLALHPHPERNEQALGRLSVADASEGRMER